MLVRAVKTRVGGQLCMAGRACCVKPRRVAYCSNNGNTADDGAAEGDAILNKYHYIDPGMISYKKAELNNLISESGVGSLTPEEVVHLLEHVFAQVTLEVVVGRVGVRSVGVVIREAGPDAGGCEDERILAVAKINGLRCAGHFRKEIIKMLIDHGGVAWEDDPEREWYVPLPVEYYG